VGTGAYFGVTAQSDFDKAKSANGINRADFDTYKQNASGNSSRADLCYAIGGAVLATGIVLVVIDTVRNSEPSKSVNVAFTGNGIGISGNW